MTTVESDKNVTFFEQLFCFYQWRLFIFISRESKWRTLKSAGNPRCAVPAESHSICTDRRRPGPAAALQVSPTSDTCQSVAILMNRPHWFWQIESLWEQSLNCLLFPEWNRIGIFCGNGAKKLLLTHLGGLWGETGSGKIISPLAASVGLHDSPLSTPSPRHVYSFFPVFAMFAMTTTGHMHSAAVTLTPVSQVTNIKAG